jgi:beta-phosphoglucomutase-like phosphatase (HAD superfamily)
MCRAPSRTPRSCNTRPPQWTPSHQLAVIEDTPSGVVAAVAAGMRAIGYAADSDEQALSNAGAELLRSLAELPRVLLNETP